MELAEESHVHLQGCVCVCVQFTQMGLALGSSSWLIVPTAVFALPCCMKMLEDNYLKKALVKWIYFYN